MEKAKCSVTRVRYAGVTRARYLGNTCARYLGCNDTSYLRGPLQTTWSVSWCGIRWLALHFTCGDRYPAHLTVALRTPTLSIPPALWLTRTLFQIDERLQVKVADYGLSRDIDADNDRAYYRIQTSRPLPLRWSAPEVLRSLQFSVKTDV
jgi:hypothetical protein